VSGGLNMGSGSIFLLGCGVLHGDISPGNICLSSDATGEAFLIDLGLAYSISEGTWRHPSVRSFLTDVASGFH
jgi:tRNA A-37 threonylcarbamoyl transferase component Bud32